MKFVPVLIVYAIILFIAAVAVKQLNVCTEKLRKNSVEIIPID